MKKINSTHILFSISILILIYTTFLFLKNIELFKSIDGNKVEEANIIEYSENIEYNENFYKSILKRLIEQDINISYEDANGKTAYGTFVEWKKIKNDDLEISKKLDEVWKNSNFFILDIENDGVMDIGFTYNDYKTPVTYLFNYHKENDTLIQNRYGIDLKALGNGMIFEKKIKENTIDRNLIFIDKFGEEVDRITYILSYDLEKEEYTYTVNNVQVTEEQWSLFMKELDSICEDVKYDKYTYEGIVSLKTY